MPARACADLRGDINLPTGECCGLHVSPEQRVACFGVVLLRGMLRGLFGEISVDHGCREGNARGDGFLIVRDVQFHGTRVCFIETFVLLVNSLHEAEALFNLVVSYPGSHDINSSPSYHLQHDHTVPISSRGRLEGSFALHTRGKGY